jgi:hypothetical protein
VRVGYTEWKREKLHVSSDSRLFIFTQNNNAVFRCINCCAEKLIYGIYHVDGSGKCSVFPILGISAFSGKAFSYSFWQNMTFDTGYRRL